jgi:hypothetical protein
MTAETGREPADTRKAPGTRRICGWLGNQFEGVGKQSRPGLASFAILLLAVMLAASAHAQQTAPAAPSNATAPQDLAKSVRNPFEDFVKVPLQSTTGFIIGPHHNAGDSLNVEPLIPIYLSSQWDLIARPSLSATYQPSPHEQYGLNDLQTSFFLTPRDATEWIWGVGPIFQFPTATGDELGTGRWSAGPTGALLYNNGPWFGGVLGEIARGEASTKRISRRRSATTSKADGMSTAIRR